MKNSSTRSVMGQMPDGDQVERVVLTHQSGIEVAIISYGAAVQSLSVPDAWGVFDNIVLGHDSLDHYIAQRNYFGSVVGRYANRIANSKFAIDGETFSLTGENGITLHGGKDGLDRRNWTLEEIGIDPEPFALFSYSSPDGDQGFPGKLDMLVRYSLTDKRELTISFEARTSQATIVNLTHHGYFNLGGSTDRDILDHHLTIFADTFLPVSSDLIPVGSPSKISGTAFDFRESTAIGARIDVDDPQLEIGRGYDHNYCLTMQKERKLRLAAILYDPHSRRVMELETDQPGLQFYSGGYLGAGILLDGRKAVKRFGALCLEPQAWPDSPNRDEFPSSILVPDEVYRNMIKFRFHVH